MQRDFIKKFFFPVLLALTLVLSGCGGHEDTRIIIFHTGDSHAKLDNFPALAYLVNEERENNEHVFLVSAGDIFSGNPVVDNYDPPGYPQIELMNRLGYDVNTFGNHEFDYGIDVLNDRLEQAQFPFVLANIDTKESGLAQPEPYFLAEAGSHSLAFFGLVQINQQRIPSTHPDKVRGIDFNHPLEAVQELSYLSDEADVVIGLTHHGFATDTIMAVNNPWIDVIIGGHSHTLTMDPPVINDVLISHSGEDLEHVGKITLIFKEGELVEKYAEMIVLEDLAGIDDEIAASVAQYKNNPALNRVIGRFASPLNNKSDIGGFVTDAYREYGNLDFAFQNYGGIRVDRMEGEITMKDIFEMDPFGNELVTIKLSYNEMRELIGSSLSSRNFPSVQISGGTMEIHLSKEGGPKEVKIFDNNDRELNHSSTYLVGMSSYIASAYEFVHEHPVSGLGLNTALVLVDYVSKFGEIGYQPSERSRIIQAD